MPLLDREYKRMNQQKNRIIDKELGRRYRGYEAMPGETFTEFKRRFRAKYENESKKYPAWIKKPNETEKEFRKRLHSSY